MTFFYSSSSDPKISPWHSRTYGNALTLSVDSSVTAMAMSPWGRDVALAGRRGLHIIDLDNPFSPPRWLRHLTSWEVADVQWSPHNHRPYWVVLSSNQKGIIWNLARSSAGAHEHVLHGHERAITDINFHNAHADVLATCSVDANCFVWDVRASTRKPVHVCCDWDTGASQVKWNHKNEYVFASAHGERLNIWDTRYGNTPLFRIRAHGGKINGLNFNKHKETEIISCSNDHTVKSWDYALGTLDLKFTVNTSFPVLKARYLPVGKAMGIMPLRGGNNCLHIIDVPEENLVVTDMQPVHEFCGHKRPITEFLWCRRFPKEEGSNNEFQLITWGKGDDLRAWKTEKSFYKKVHYNYNGPQNERDLALTNTLKTFKYTTYRDESNTTYNFSGGKITNILTSDVKWLSKRIEVKDHLRWINSVITDDANDGTVNLQDPYNLGKELRLTHIEEFPEVVFEEIYIAEGKLTISLYSPVLSQLEDLIVCSESDKPAVRQSLAKGHEKSQEKKRAKEDGATSGSVKKVNSNENGNKNLKDTKPDEGNIGTKSKDQNDASNDFENGDSKKAESTQKESKNGDTKDEGGKPGLTKSSSSNYRGEKSSIFLRIRLNFPKRYPAKAGPSCHVESNHDTNRTERDAIKTLLEYIGSKCVSVDRFCLEMVLRFLVGTTIDLDAMLEQARVLIGSSDEEKPGIEGAGKRTGKTKTKKSNKGEVGNGGEVHSSDEGETGDDEEEEDVGNTEEEEVIDDDGEEREDDDDDDDDDDEDEFVNQFDVENSGPLLATDLTADEALLFRNEPVVLDNFNTPGEIQCGARWAPNGQLIFFTKPKSKRKTEGVVFTPDYYFNEKPVQRYDMKLGRALSKAARVQNLFTNNLYGEMGSEDSEETEDSADDEDYFDHVGSPYGFSSLMFPNRVRNAASRNGFSKGEVKRVRNVVSILDFSSILPSKVELAQEYQIIGKSAYEIAARNARAASDLLTKSAVLSEEFLEISNVWNLVKVLVLSQELKQDVLDARINGMMQEYYNDASMRLFRRYSNKHDWGLGLHLFGNLWLIKNVIGYFEAKHDIQMLAMLSCVLFGKGELLPWNATEGKGNYFDERILAHELPFTNDSNFDEYAALALHDSSTEPPAAPVVKGYGTSPQYAHSAPFVVEHRVYNAPEFRLEITADAFLNEKASYGYETLFGGALMFRLQKYRDIYSDMLLSWGLPLKRIEVMKCDYRDADGEDDSNSTANGYGAYATTKKYRMLEVGFAEYGEKPLVCDYCLVPVKRQQIQICNNCHHVLHAKCAKRWFRGSEGRDGASGAGAEEECPSGCGCRCLRHL